MPSKKKTKKNQVPLNDLRKAMETLVRYGNRFSFVIRTISTINLAAMEQTFKFLAQDGDIIKEFLQAQMEDDLGDLCSMGPAEIQTVLGIINDLKKVQTALQNYNQANIVNYY